MQSPNSRPTAMPRRSYTALRMLIAFAAAALVAACGGSGSSGFDLAAENAAIDKALDTGTCQMDQGLTICASGATSSPTMPPASPTPTTTVAPTDSATPTATQRGITPTATTTASSVTGTPTPTGTPPSAPTSTPTTRPPDTPTPTPTATLIPAQPGVDTNVASSDSVTCESAGPGQPCAFLFTFVPSGIPATAAYRVAVRGRDPNGDWAVYPVVDHGALIAVDPNVSTIQIAVLVFLADPGFVPDRIALLGDSGADYAFVTSPLTLQPLTLAAP